MGRLAGFNYREVIRKMKVFGFVLKRQAAGSHEIWFHPETRRFVTIPNHNYDLPEGTLRSILRQAEIDVDSFLML